MTFDELCEEYAKTDSFMEPQIAHDKRWIIVDGPRGTEAIPSWATGGYSQWGDIKNYCDNTSFWTIEEKEGYGARLHAPGYLDCTDWAVFDTEQEAIDYLEQMYLE